MAVVSHKSVISPVLVGRQSELDVLGALLEQCTQGHGQLALLVGEAGIGKSRLTAEFKRKASAVGCWTLEGHCDEPDHLIPYSPLLEILRNHLNDPDAGASVDDIVQSFGPVASTVAKLFPELELPIIEPALVRAPEQERRLLHHGLTQYFQELAAQRPLLLIVEDLHWSDDPTLEFLLYLIRRLTDHPIFLLLTYRGNEIGTELGRFLDAVERQRVAVEVVLTPLTAPQIDEMMRAIFELARPVRGEFLQAVTELTEGNPFFIEEVLKTLLAVGDIYYGDSAWDRRPLGLLRIPRSISDAVQRRASSLSTAAQQLLCLAAVAGHRFDVAVLQAVMQQSEETLLETLKELIAAQLIVEVVSDEFAFRHALTQQALYANLLSRERQAMHRTLAQALVQRHADALDAYVPELAYHFHAGGAWKEALFYTQRAGERSQKMYLPQAALKQYSRALEAANHLLSSSLSASSVTPLKVACIYHARGLAHEMVGNFDDAQADLQEALVRVRAHPEQPATGQLEWQLLVDLGFLWASRDYARTGDYYQQSLALAQRLEEPSLLAHTYNRVGNWQLNRGEPKVALQAYHQALTIFETLPDRRGLAQTLDLMGMASGQVGDLASLSYYEQAATLFRALDDRIGLVSALSMLGPMRIFIGGAEGAAEDAAKAAAEFAEAFEVAQRIGFQSGEAFLLSEYAQALSWRGDFGVALTYVQRSLALAQEIEHHQWQVAALVTLGSIYLDLVADELAHTYLVRALTLAQEIGSQIFIQLASACLALAYLDLGKGELAEGVLAKITLETPVSYYDHLCWVARIRLALWHNDPALTLQLIAQCDPIFAAGDRANWIALSVCQAQGEAWAALDDPQAEAVLHTMCEIAQRKGFRPLLWRGRIELGKYLLNKRRVDDAHDEFASARATIEELAAGVEDVALCTTFRQRALGMIPLLAAPTARQAAKRAFDGLTAAEQQVAALVAHGKSNREIAAAQVVSIKTVEAHISHILSKLGFASRTQIAVWAMEKGLSDASSNGEDAA